MRRFQESETGVLKAIFMNNIRYAKRESTYDIFIVCSILFLIIISF